ncbi:serine/threonine-protein phosphatase 7 inactive-like protein, partial [Trifolium medium]|nr:serine/threonine-protein phosphatase 7 inactive-like protein [Trifolium medium]
DVEASTSGFSAPQDAARPEFDFESLGIYNAPSWSVQLPDSSGGTQLVQVPRAPSVEGLLLSPNIQEPHKGAYEYLFELVAGLKHMIARRETENRALLSALRSRARKRKSTGHS